MHLPVIIASGGINSAGRSSFHHAFKWFIRQSLPIKQRQEVILSLLSLTNSVKYQQGQYWLDQRPLLESDLLQLESVLENNTLIRQLDLKNMNLDFHNKIHIKDKADVLKPLLDDANLNDDLQKVHYSESTSLFVDSLKKLLVNSGSQTPTGFDPSVLYNAVNHPRGLQLAIYAISDCLYSSGFNWKELTSLVDSAQIGVYASSMLGQLDVYGAAGYIQSRLRGQRTSGKSLPLSMPQMVADFINSYVLDNIGHTQAAIGACATFLYNLYNAVVDIQTGRRRLAVVGAADAPLLPEVIEGYAAMKALSTDQDLVSLDNLSPSSTPNYQRACRPFGKNTGFVLGESSQFFILCDDKLAIDMGADILGSVAGVFINADGYKGSISKPGPGNLFSLMQATALAKSIIGEKELQHNTFVSAHGTGTPQNRVSESLILSMVAKLNHISNWPVCAIKSYVGHSTGCAGGDQLSAALGSFATGWLPGIRTIDEVAEDVYQQNLHFCLQHEHHDPHKISGGFINSKGFGGNNASAFILSAHKTLETISQNMTAKQLQEYEHKKQQRVAKASLNNQLINQKELKPIYNRFGEQKIKTDPHVDGNVVYWGQYRSSLPVDNPYSKK